MSCQACEEAQSTDINDGGIVVLHPILYTYVRIGTGNVLISGCKQHLKELLDRLRAPD